MEQFKHLNDENKVTVLQMAHDTHRQEMMHHREMQFRAFSWTNSLFLAVAAALVAFGSTWTQYRQIGALVLTIMVIAISVSTLFFLRRNQNALETNARVIIKIDTQLGLFEKGYYGSGESIYPQRWLEWGDKRRASIETWFYMVTTVIVGTMVIVVAWVLG
jgi:hypothetical protein